MCLTFWNLYTLLSLHTLLAPLAAHRKLFCELQNKLPKALWFNEANYERIELTQCPWCFFSVPTWALKTIFVLWEEMVISGRLVVSAIWGGNNICYDFPVFSLLYAAVNGHLELTHLKGRQRFDAGSTSNLEVYKFRDWWIFTYLIFEHGES